MVVGVGGVSARVIQTLFESEDAVVVGDTVVEINALTGLASVELAIGAVEIGGETVALLEVDADGGLVEVHTFPDEVA